MYIIVYVVILVQSLSTFWLIFAIVQYLTNVDFLN